MEIFFACAILVVVGIATVASIPELVQLDWASNETLYEFIYRVLLLVIGLELARLLITHDLQAVTELIAFVIARKTLKPDVDAQEVLYVVVAFFLLALSRLVINFDLRDWLCQNYGRTKNSPK